MKVLKFGGTSVGSAERIKEVARLITQPASTATQHTSTATQTDARNIVVLSAMSGTTNALVEVCDYLAQGNRGGAQEVLNALGAKYATHVEQLYTTEEYHMQARKMLEDLFENLSSLIRPPLTPQQEKIILEQGEQLSTGMMNLYLQEKGINSQLLPALDFMRTDENGEPDAAYIKEHLLELLSIKSDADIFITQGFICRNAAGEVSNLQRGGSDYSASLIGAAVQAEEIQIWTDIDGMHNNDPRVVAGTTPVRNLHFDEAAELAYFGAKILHPTCILPAKLSNIPVRLLNTLEPTAAGTLISGELVAGTIKAVAAKEGITAIKIKSDRMLLATGFLRRVFEVFENHRTPIDMVTTSEVGVSVTIDNDRHLAEIVADLKTFGTVTVDPDMVIVCVVGDLGWENVGFEARIVQALREIPVRMISFGGSNYNVTALVRATDKKRALQALSNGLFA